MIAYFELCCAKGLRCLDPAAVRTLGFNQGGTRVAADRIRSVGDHPRATGTNDAQIAASDPQLAETLMLVEGLTRLISYAMNGGTHRRRPIAQGSLAAYYFSRVKYMKAHVTQTPDDRRRAEDWQFALSRLRRESVESDDAAGAIDALTSSSTPATVSPGPRIASSMSSM